jgi:hypothetical protein
MFFLPLLMALVSLLAAPSPYPYEVCSDGVQLYYALVTLFGREMSYKP